MDFIKQTLQKQRLYGQTLISIKVRKTTQLKHLLFMKFIRTTAIALSVFSFSLSTYAQLTIDGEFRTRSIIDHGLKIPVLSSTDPIFSIDQRSRLIFNYDSEKYSSGFTLQDARVWGNDDMTNKTGIEGNSYATEVHEAWIDLNLSKKTSLKIGRQEWNYNDMRILSSRNWWTSGLSYDGLLLKRHDKEKGLFLDLGLSYNNNGTNIGLVNNSDWESTKIKSMNFINAKKAFGNRTSISLMLSLSSKVDTSNDAQLATGTHGIIFNHNNSGSNTKNGIFGNFSGYYQHGTDLSLDSDGSYMNISAYLIAAEIGLRTLDKKLEASVGMNLISGRDYSNTDTDYTSTRHTFDLQYSARFPYYGGNMNYFLLQESYITGTKSGGYFDPFLKVRYKASKKDIINASVFLPTLTTKVRAHNSIDPTTQKPTDLEVDANNNPVYWSGNLGVNIDLGYTHKFSKEIILKAGFSYAMVSDIKNQMVYGYANAATKELKSLGSNYYGWLMLVVKPNFLSK